jgi:hypothetical protein
MIKSQFKTRLILLEQTNRLSNKIELADMYDFSKLGVGIWELLRGIIF